MKFPLVLFDADDTLFDFSRSEKHSFVTILAEHGIEVGDSIYLTYKEISARLWKMFEQGKISKQYLRVGRFKMLIESHRFEADPHALSQGYLEVLKEQVFLTDGALELCTTLARNSKIGIVTNGIEEVQKHRLMKSALAPHIDFMVVSEECGYAKPHRGIFDFTLGKAPNLEVSNILMVGDRLETDILGAQTVGMKTCWYNPNKGVAEVDITPDFEIHELSTVLDIVRG